MHRPGANHFHKWKANGQKMVPNGAWYSMSGANCSQPLCRPLPWSICNGKSGGSSRGEEEEGASVRLALEPHQGGVLPIIWVPVKPDLTPESLSEWNLLGLHPWRVTFTWPTPPSFHPQLCPNPVSNRGAVDSEAGVIKNGWLPALLHGPSWRGRREATGEGSGRVGMSN